MQAGNCARLFHREYECYIAAEGSFAENSILVEDGEFSSSVLSSYTMSCWLFQSFGPFPSFSVVHCRKRHSDHGILKAPSTSANTYWQFEKESFPCSGEPLSWGERCRIKHMPTRCYLAVVTSNNSPHQDIQYKVHVVSFCCMVIILFFGVFLLPLFFFTFPPSFLLLFPHLCVQVTLKDLEDPDFNKLDTVFTMTPAIKVIIMECSMYYI